MSFFVILLQICYKLIQGDPQLSKITISSIFPSPHCIAQRVHLHWKQTKCILCSSYWEPRIQAHFWLCIQHVTATSAG